MPDNKNKLLNKFYNEYRRNGGWLSFNEWQQSGMPKVERGMQVGDYNYDLQYESLPFWKRPYTAFGTANWLDPQPDFPIAGLKPGVAEKAAQWKPPGEDTKITIGDREKPEDIPGFAWIPTYDENGKIVNWYIERDPTFQQPQQPMSPYEQANIDLQTQLANAQAQKAYRERVDTQTWQRMLSDTARLQTQQRFGEQEAGDIWAQQAQREAFESQRGDEGGSPRDWIIRFMSENPYNERVGPTPIDVAQRAVWDSETAAAQARGTAESPVVGYDDLLRFQAENLEENIIKYEQLLNAQKSKAAALQYVTNPNLRDKSGKSVYRDLSPVKRQEMQALGMSVMGGEGGGGELDWQVQAREDAERREKGAPVPNWMRSMAGVSRVTPAMKGSLDIPTPSMGAWSKLLSSQRQQFAGFVDFAGKRPYADILDQMAINEEQRIFIENQMRPGTPSGARGARVRPALQR